MKIGMDVVPPLFCLSLRYALAFLIFLPFFGKRVIDNMTRIQVIPYLIISGFTAGAFVTCAYALMLTTATNTGFLMSTAAIFTPFFSYFVLNSKIDKANAVPIAIVTIGLYLLCSDGSGFSLGPGELFALLCAVCGALMLVFSSKYIHDNDPLTFSVMQTGFTGLFCIIAALLLEDIPKLSEIPLMGWGVIVYLAIGCTCVAYVLQNISLRHVPATYVAVAFCSEPIFTAIASFILLGETLALRGGIGAVLIMVSIVMASLMPEELPEALETGVLPENKTNELADTKISST